jgi:glycosyltransferase involved in cell wall biosynthesis
VTQAMGGVKTHIKYILEYASANRFQFEIIAPEDQDLMDFARHRGIPYHVVPFHRGIHPIKDLISLMRLSSLLRKKKYDAVHLHSAKAGILGRFACKTGRHKSVFTPNGFSYLGAKGLKRIIFFSIETLFRNTATKIFAVSHCEANRAIYELGSKPAKVVVVQNAIMPLQQEQQARGTRPAKVISTIGRLTSQKNLVRFVEIANAVVKQSPDLEFRILGAGYHDDQKEEILDLIKYHGLKEKIRIIEWSYKIDISQYLVETDIYISTSIFEGLPYSILEAMSLGIPCVASFCDGNNDIITSTEDGFLCNSNDQFVSVLLRLINEPSLRNQISEKAKQTVQKRFDIRDRSLLLSEEYIKIIKG